MKSLFSAIAGGTIKEGVIFGVSVISIGEAKGHNIFVDKKSLETFLASAKSRPGGIPVKMDHGSGFDNIVGKLESFRIEGDSLRADLHLLKAHEAYPRIVEMAETMAESFGLSTSATLTIEKIDGQSFARCDELTSVDLVDRPAANPNGLFQVDSSAKGMAEKFDAFVAGLKNLVGASENTELAAATGKVTELTTKISTLETNLAEKDKAIAAKDSEITALNAAQTDFDVKVEKAASARALQITASLGVPPVTIAPVADPAAPPKSEKTGFARTQELIEMEISNRK